jgi:hypothetical protein
MIMRDRFLQLFQWAGLTAMAVVACGAVAAAQGGGSRTPVTALTSLDYIEIQQLVAKYAYALDTGADNGYAYADLFTEDGVFTGMNQGPNGRSYTGRDNLAALARGGRRGPLFVSHFIDNVVISPAPGGAVGKQYVAILKIGDGREPHSVDHGGRYEDVYEKTPKGWRFKSRTFYESEGGPMPSQLGKHPAAPARETK